MHQLYLSILQNIKEKGLKLSQVSVTILWKMAYFKKANVKLTSNQLKKVESAWKK